jgi:hypothetical protein
MRLSTAVKVVVLAGVAVCTMWVTSEIVGQTRKTKKKSGPETASSPANTVTRAISSGAKTVVRSTEQFKPNTNRDAAANEEIPDTLRSSIAVVGALGIRQIDGEVNVGLTIRTYETRPAISFLWSLRVFQDSQNPRLIFEEYYRNEIFKVPLREMAVHTFHESFALPPGSYRVQVNLHKIPEGFDFSRLTDNSTWERSLAVSVSQKVKVSP